MRYVPTSIGSSRLNQNYNAVENPQIGKSLIPETKKLNSIIRNAIDVPLKTL